MDEHLDRDEQDRPRRVFSRLPDSWETLTEAEKHAWSQSFAAKILEAATEADVPHDEPEEEPTEPCGGPRSGGDEEQDASL